MPRKHLPGRPSKVHADPQATPESVIGWLRTIAPLAHVPFKAGDGDSVDLALARGGLLRLDFDAEAGVLMLSSALRQVGVDGRPELFERAMRLNHLGQGTGGAALGWNAEQDELVMSAALPMALLDEEAFLGLLNGFAAQVEHLRGELDDRAAASAQPISPADARPFLHRMA